MARSFAKDSFSRFGFRIALFFISMLTSAVVARAIGPTGKGLVSLAFLVPNFAVTFLELDMDFATTYLIAKDHKSASAILGNSLMYGLFVSLGGLVILYPSLPFILPRWFEGFDQPTLIYVSILSIPIALVNSTLRATLLGFREIGFLNLVEFLQPIVYVALVAGVALLFSLTPLAVVILLMLSNVFLMASTAMLLIRKGFITRLRCDASLMKEALKYGLKRYPGSLIQKFNYRFDSFIVAALLGPTELGLYTVAVSVAELILHLPKAIGVVLLPKVASEPHAKSDAYVPTVLRIVVFLVVGAAVVLFIGSEFVVTLVYGEDFGASSTPLRILLPGIVVYSVWRILATYFSGQGKPEYRSYSSGIGLAITLALDFLLIPELGIAGAAIASSVAYLVAATILVALFRRKTGIALRQIWIINLHDVRTMLDVARRVTLAPVQFLSTLRQRS